MDIFETIRKHATAIRLPLYAVTLSAVARKQTPALLILHWHGFRRATTLRLPGVEFSSHAVPGLAVQLHEYWTEMAHWDQAVLDAAWQLGAWDLERSVHPPWWRLNAPQAETLACYRAFGFYPDADAGQSVTDPSEETIGALLEMASRFGYARWLFQPRVQGIWTQLRADDVTLEAANGRTLPCPVRPALFDRHKPGRLRYRLGRGSSFFS